VKVAEEDGIPDFVVNARTDALFSSPINGFEEAIVRGKAYLEAGASNIFIWGGPSRKGWSKQDVKKATEALDGRLNVLLKMKPDGSSVKQLGEIGVCRISVGPQLMRRIIGVLAEDASAETLAVFLSGRWPRAYPSVSLHTLLSCSFLYM
jgi:2-methylisocitrate lyase-like PEP mutase family enzyme